jgi:hypothetical protein
MKKRILAYNFLRIALCLVFVLVSRDMACAATVRGRLDHVYPNGQRAPGVGFAVTVYRADIGRSQPTYTGQDGIYYLNNIPPGTYNLEIWTSRVPGVPPTVYVIQVSEPFVDIPPIYV